MLLLLLAIIFHFFFRRRLKCTKLQAELISIRSVNNSVEITTDVDAPSANDIFWAQCTHTHGIRRTNTHAQDVVVGVKS